jgi:protein XagA
VRSAGGLLLIVCLAAPAPALANAWAQPKGQGQVILKVEALSAEDGYDQDGQVRVLPAERLETAARLLAEYGLTERVTVQLKADYQSGEDAFVDYDGRGPLEIGVTWQAWRDDYSAVSLYAGYADAGEGRNADYARPGVGEYDFEVRAAAGTSWVLKTAGAPDQAFVEVELARRMRDGLPDEVRADATAGAWYGDWLLLGQAFGGQTDDEGARWLSLESSIVRRMGGWSVQAGWRQTVAGREVAKLSGPVVGVWRRF